MLKKWSRGGLRRLLDAGSVPPLYTGRTGILNREVDDATRVASDVLVINGSCSDPRAGIECTDIARSLCPHYDNGVPAWKRHVGRSPSNCTAGRRAELDVAACLNQPRPVTICHEKEWKSRVAG